MAALSITGGVFVEGLRFCPPLSVQGKCPHAGDADIESERASATTGTEWGGPPHTAASCCSSSLTSTTFMQPPYLPLIPIINRTIRQANSNRPISINPPFHS